jgi:hypothetical protein
MDTAQEISPTIKWDNASDIRWILLPLLAVFGGAWVYRDTSLTILSTELLTMVALILGGWMPLWHATTHTHWSYPIAQWQQWTETEPLPIPPYLQRGTAGFQLYLRLSQVRVWWKKVGQQHLALPLRQAILGLFVSLLLGYISGRPALLLTLMYCACTQLAVLWSGAHREAGSGWLGLTQVGLPWLLGASITQGIQLSTVASSLVLIILVGLYVLPSHLSLIGPVLAAIYLIWQEHTVPAGWLLLLSLPGLLRLGQHPAPSEYRSATLPWILCMIGLIAMVL